MQEQTINMMPLIIGVVFQNGVFRNTTLNVFSNKEDTLKNP
jgi:hypothetical protein